MCGAIPSPTATRSENDRAGGSPDAEARDHGSVATVPTTRRSNASEAVANLRRDVGIADGLAEFGVTEDRIDELAERTLGMERLLSRNARRMTRDDVEQVLQRAL